MENSYKYFIGVRFDTNAKAYFFGTNDDTLKLEDKVVVDNTDNVVVATVCTTLTSTDNYKSNLELKSIIRKADKNDLLLYDHNIKRSKEAIKIAQNEIDKLNLGMNILSAEYVLDGSKITISYVSEKRVDFRELLKILAPQLHCRIELHQVGSRDRAKNIGGIGICGLPLCCSSFLNEFDGISINRAKNQLLTLNISKLSGHCGKLICCLLFEDEAYTDAKKDFPTIGTTIKKDDMIYKITGYNVLSKSVRIESEDDVQFIDLEEIKRLLKNDKR